MPGEFADLITQRLVLRRMCAADAEVMFAYRSDPDVCRYQPWAPSELEEVRMFVEEMAAIEPDQTGTWFQMAITLKSGRLIGDVGLHFPKTHERQVETGISLAFEFQHRGYATEAMEAVLEYAFGALAKHRVFATIDPRNLPSIRMVERLGMRKEAHFRQSVWFKGEWADDLVYALLRSEWLAR